MFGDRIKELRRQIDITQKTLASILFVSTNTIGNWEQNKSIPSYDDCLRLCAIFNCSMEYLTGGENIDEYNKKVIALDSVEALDNYIFTINHKKLTKEQLKALVEMVRLLR